MKVTNILSGPSLFAEVTGKYKDLDKKWNNFIEENRMQDQNSIFVPENRYQFVFPANSDELAENLDWFREIVSGKHGIFEEVTIELPNIFVDSSCILDQEELKKSAMNFGTACVFHKYRERFLDYCEVIRKNHEQGLIDIKNKKISIRAYLESSMEDDIEPINLSLLYLFEDGPAVEL